MAHRLPIAQAARDAGWTVTVATAPGPGIETLSKFGFSHITLPIARFNFAPYRDAQLLLAIRSLMASSRFQVVHLFTIKPLFFGGLAARMTRENGANDGSRLIGTMAGLGRALDESGPRWRTAATLKGLAAGLGSTAHAITFENEGDRDFCVANRVFDFGQTHVFPGAGIDLDQFVPAPELRQPSTVTILFAGRLLRSKGVMDVVAAAKILRGQFANNVRVLIAGPHSEGDPDGLDVAERHALGAERQVEFLGAVPPDEIPRLMASADIFVLPTRYPEGLPRVLLEAGATGAALLAGDVDGTRAFITDNVNGILLKDTRGSSIATALAGLVNDPELRSRLGTAARARLEQGRFSVADVAARFVDLYGRDRAFGEASKLT